MELKQIDAATHLLNEDATTLSQYFDGLDELEFLLNYDELYQDTRIAVQTWDTANNFSATAIEKGRDARRLITQCVIVSSTIIEYLSSISLFQRFVLEETRHAPAEFIQDGIAEFIEEENQYARENLLDKSGVTTGRIEDKMNRIRGTRNKVAHNLQEPLSLKNHDHPFHYLSDVREVISFLVENVYGKPLDEAVKTVHDSFVNGRSTNIADWTTAQVVDRYVMITHDLVRRQERGEWDWDDESIPESKQDLLAEAEALEEVLVERGFNPEEALNLGRPQRFDLEKNVTQVQGERGPLHIVEAFIPEETVQFQSTEFNATFAFSDTVNEQVNWFDADNVEWYAILFVDDSVVAVDPADEMGVVSPTSASIEEQLEVSFEHTFDDWDDHTVSIGAQAEIDAGALVTKTDPVDVHVESDSFVEIGNLEYGF